MPYIATKHNGKKVDLHRHIMQEHLGRKLDINEVVHHIDGNTLNNELSNLQVMSRSEHSRLHNIGQKRSPESCAKMRAVSIRTMPNKLTEDQVWEIIKKHGNGIKVPQLANEYNVTKANIYKIVSLKRWKHLHE